MNKISTKLRQKQTAIPKQILQSRFLEMSITDIEEELQNEIEKNPVLVEKDIEDLKPISNGFIVYRITNNNYSRNYFW